MCVFEGALGYWRKWKVGRVHILVCFQTNLNNWLVLQIMTLLFSVICNYFVQILLGSICTEMQMAVGAALACFVLQHSGKSLLMSIMVVGYYSKSLLVCCYGVKLTDDV